MMTPAEIVDFSNRSRERVAALSAKVEEIKNDALSIATDMDAFGKRVEAELPPSEQKDQFLGLLAALKSASVDVAAGRAGA